jgi:hypothetical protein
MGARRVRGHALVGAQVFAKAGFIREKPEPTGTKLDVGSFRGVRPGRCRTLTVEDVPLNHRPKTMRPG